MICSKGLKRCFEGFVLPRNSLIIQFLPRVSLGTVLTTFTNLNVASKSLCCSHYLLLPWLSTKYHLYFLGTIKPSIEPLNKFTIQFTPSIGGINYTRVSRVIFGN